MSDDPARASICVVVPCFDEEEVLPLFYERLTPVLENLDSYDYEILFVDDGSSDSTLDLLRQWHETDPHVGLLSLSRNFGHQIALSAGIDACEADAAIIMDCDLQHPPELILDLIARWKQGAQIVSAVRVASPQSSRFKQMASGTFYRAINFLSDTPIAANTADFGLLSREALDAFRAMPERHRFLRGMISWIGFRREFVEFQAPPRAAGVSKYSWRKMTALAMTAIYSFSARPLRLAIRAGVAVAALGLLYLLFVLWAVVFRSGDLVPGWTSVIGVLLVIGGVQLVFTGLIGEYIARLYEEAKHRPLYFVKESKRPRGEAPTS